MSSYRTQTIYITGRTLKRLGLVQRLYPQKAKGEGNIAIEQREMTRDELADNLINDCITENYSEVIKLEKELADAEKNFMNRFKGKT